MSVRTVDTEDGPFEPTRYVGCRPPFTVSPKQGVSVVSVYDEILLITLSFSSFCDKLIFFFDRHGHNGVLT